MNGVDGSHHLLIAPEYEGHSKLKFSHLFATLFSISLQNFWQSNPIETFAKSKFSSGGQVCSLLI